MENGFVFMLCCGGRAGRVGEVSGGNEVLNGKADFVLTLETQMEPLQKSFKDTHTDVY